MVRIPDSHSGGPGSIPGCGTFYQIDTPQYQDHLLFLFCCSKIKLHFVVVCYLDLSDDLLYLIDGNQLLQSAFVISLYIYSLPMSLLECMYCKHRSYLVCCSQQQVTISTICEACIYEFPVNAHQNCGNCHKSITRNIIAIQNQRQRQAAMAKFRQSQQLLQGTLLPDKRNLMGNYQNERNNRQPTLQNPYLDKNCFKLLNQTKIQASFPTYTPVANQRIKNTFGFASEEMQLTAKQIEAANEVLNFPVDSNTRLNRERIKGGEKYMHRNGLYRNEYESSIGDESDGHTISDLNR